MSIMPPESWEERPLSEFDGPIYYATKRIKQLEAEVERLTKLNNELWKQSKETVKWKTCL